MTRFRASSIHFLLSLLVGVSLFLCFWFVWYPSPMLMAIGGHEIFILVVGIDIVLGPLLTLVVFKANKKNLKFDLSIIAIMQLSALVYGVETLLVGRPVFIAALGSEFEVVQAVSISEVNLNKNKTGLPFWGPKLVGTSDPVSLVDKIMAEDLPKVGAGRGHMPQLHIPYKDMKDVILKNSQDVSNLFKTDLDKKQKIQQWLINHNQLEENIKFQPIRIGASKFPIIINATTAEVIGIIPVSI